MPIVSIRKTHGDDYPAIRETVNQVLTDLGGLSDIIKPGYKVIIKPNLVAPPTERLSGGISRWEVCKALVEAVRAEGATPIIAESAAAGVDTELVIQACEYQQLRDEGIPVIDLKAEQATCDIPVEHGTQLQSFKSWELVRDADAIITVPVMKTHDQTEVTLGMKNCKGLLTDVQKKQFHTIQLVECVCDMIQTLKPVLEIIDGTYGQQGYGPIYGETKRMDLIVGSKDLVACETITSRIMGYEPAEVMITKTAYERGLGEMDLSKIQVVGETVESVQSRFKRSSEVEIEGLPASFQRIFDKHACTGCYNTVISALMDMRDLGMLDQLENKTVCVGPVTEDQLPEGASPENTACVGRCAKKLADAKGFRCAIGCPPNNANAIQAMTGDRNYGDRYATNKA